MDSLFIYLAHGSISFSPLSLCGGEEGPDPLQPAKEGMVSIPRAPRHAPWGIPGLTAAPQTWGAAGTAPGAGAAFPPRQH